MVYAIITSSLLLPGPYFLYNEYDVLVNTMFLLPHSTLALNQRFKRHGTLVPNQRYNKHEIDVASALQ